MDVLLPIVNFTNCRQPPFSKWKQVCGIWIHLLLFCIFEHSIDCLTINIIVMRQTPAIQYPKRTGLNTVVIEGTRSRCELGLNGVLFRLEDDSKSMVIGFVWGHVMVFTLIIQKKVQYKLIKASPFNWYLSYITWLKWTKGMEDFLHLYPNCWKEDTDNINQRHT